MAFTLKNVPVSEVQSRFIALMPSTTLTTTTTSTGKLIGIDCFSVIDLHLNITAASGTSPLLDVYVQRLCPDNVTWDDLVHFTQASAAADYMATVVVGNAGVHTIAVRTLAAGTVRSTGSTGGIWRVDCVIAGTTPSFTFQLFGDFTK